MLLFDRFGVGLGTLLGPLLGAKLAPNRSKFGPEGSRDDNLLKKLFFHEILRFPILFGLRGTQDGAQEGPRSDQEGPERVPKAIFFCIEISLRFLIDFGSVLGRFGGPKWSPRGEGDLVFWALGGLLGASWGLLGTSWGLLVPLGLFLGAS